MPFGIKPAMGEFQCHQQDIQTGFSAINILADDIMVYRCGDNMMEAMADHDHNLIGLPGK